MSRSRRAKVVPYGRQRMTGPPLGDGPWRVELFRLANPSDTVAYARFRAYTFDGNSWPESLDPVPGFEFLGPQKGLGWRVKVMPEMADPPESKRARYKVVTSTQHRPRRVTFGFPGFVPWIDTWHLPGLYRVDAKIGQNPFPETAFMKVEADGATGPWRELFYLPPNFPWPGRDDDVSWTITPTAEPTPTQAPWTFDILNA